LNISAQQKKGFCERNDSSCGGPTAGGFKIAVLDRCSVVSAPPLKSHRHKSEAFLKFGWTIRGGVANSGLNLICFAMKTCRLSLILIIFAFAFAYPASAAENLFVTTRYSNTTAVIDTSTNQVVTSIPVGAFPVRITMTPNRLKAFVSNGHSSNMSVLDTVALTNIATIPVGESPGEEAVTPDGARLFVVHQRGQHGSGCPVYVIDTATYAVLNIVYLPGNWLKDILFTPDGRFAYVANQSSGQVDVIDTATYEVTIIPSGAGSRRLCISPAADRVYCANYIANTVTVVDTATKQLVANIPVGQRPRAIAITPDGREVYTANTRDGTVSVINTTTLSVVATIPTGGVWPWELVMTADGTKAFVSNTNSDNVSVINTATHTVSALIPVGHGPFIAQVSPDQTKSYVSNARDTTVTVIDIASLTVIATVPNVGSQPFDIAFAPGGGGPTPTPSPSATPTPTPGPIQLVGQPRRIGGINISRLRWTGATSPNVDVYRDGNVIATTPNNGSYDDNTGTSGEASFMYQVCEAGTQTCSNTVTVAFGP
jgi:YVTN family beta-propeller protein